MMTKYQMISAMAEYTAREVTQNEQEWTRYLTIAARLYKYPFHEQMLIFAQRIAFDYYEELLSELFYVKEDSFFEELDEQNLGIRIRETLASSIACTLLSRCGSDMELRKEDMNFEYIHDFSNTKVLSVLGIATSEMSKPILMEIGRTIGAYDKQIARNKAKNGSWGTD